MTAGLTFAQIVVGLVANGVAQEKAELTARMECGLPQPAAKPEQPDDGMNKTERRRSVELEALKRAGQIRSWEFEDVTLRLAHRTRYTPDFFIEHNDGRIEFEEIKGAFIREDGWIKCKMAARVFPMFRFTLRQWKGGQWHVKYVKP